MSTDWKCRFRRWPVGLFFDWTPAWQNGEPEGLMVYISLNYRCIPSVFTSEKLPSDRCCSGEILRLRADLSRMETMQNKSFFQIASIYFSVSAAPLRLCPLFTLILTLDWNISFHLHHFLSLSPSRILPIKLFALTSLSCLSIHYSVSAPPFLSVIHSSVYPCTPTCTYHSLIHLSSLPFSPQSYVKMLRLSYVTINHNYKLHN